MEKLINFAKYVDFIAAFGAIGWGFYSSSWLWMGSGAIGVVVAFFQPAKHIQKFAESFLVKKKPKRSVSTPTMDIPVNKPNGTVPARNVRKTQYFVKPFPGCNDFTNTLARWNSLNK